MGYVCLVPLSFIYSCRFPKLFGQSSEMDFGWGVGGRGKLNFQATGKVQYLS